MPIEGRDLTKDEFNELKKTTKKLYREALAYNPDFTFESSPLRDIKIAYKSFDLATIRVYAKLLSAFDYHTGPLYEVISYLYRYGNLATGSWLTADHVTAYDYIHRAILVHESESGKYDTYNNDRVCSLLFPDCSEAAFIESLIVHRGMTQYHDIVRAIKELPRNHHALQSGSL